MNGTDPGMAPRPRRIAVLGGTGFVGTAVVSRLAAAGHELRVLTRDPRNGRPLAVLPTVRILRADVHDEPTLRQAFTGCDTVINLVGILNEKGFSGAGFAHAHAELARKTVAQAVAAGATRLLHMSALGAAPDGPSFYLQSKGVAERHVRAAPASLRWTIFRPSVIFGAGDSFMNRFAGLLRLSQGVIPLARAEARFAPIWVDDVAAAFAHALDDRMSDGAPLPGGSSVGRAYDLCGPEIFTLGDLVRLAGGSAGIRTRVLPLPDAVARLQARVMDFVPGKPFSTDNYRSLTVDNVCREDGCAPLGIVPASLRALAPTYLRR